ncbi:hypothetical protein [Chelatococcus asaccharovorans]|uniref:hypothetical protein n=1 Tax=Chelatococcus asaccharovorans TaxID=28210 RepID=UPI0022643234|nr:hypothetical protein [Chelatococcus asaccharovorans]
MADLMPDGMMSEAGNLGRSITVRRGQPYVPRATVVVGIKGVGIGDPALTYPNDGLARILRHFDESDVNDTLDLRENRPHLLLHIITHFREVTGRIMLIVRPILRNILWETETYVFILPF